ncbi:MAG: 30S ribosomal protein S4 [Candidatus Magasanikbacteria bacterium]|nr:30S ribosomal protein S4 [Candidatus Magasanikbacteria bacterium]
MARLIGPKHKLCRLWGEKLCDSPKCPVMKRNFPSGQHGLARKRAKLSSFGKQLREKQKAKKLYGILEKQFSNYVAEASKKTGDTSKFLVQYLESRLDNVAYRAGFAPSRAAARQAVSHGHITVNGKKLDIPSYRVRVGEIVAVAEPAKKSKLFTDLSETIAKKDLPAWVNVDATKLSAKVLNLPTVELPNFDANAIIGFYSR